MPPKARGRGRGRGRPARGAPRGAAPGRGAGALPGAPLAGAIVPAGGLGAFLAALPAAPPPAAMGAGFPPVPPAGPGAAPGAHAPPGLPGMLPAPAPAVGAALESWLDSSVTPTVLATPLLCPGIVIQLVTRSPAGAVDGSVYMVVSAVGAPGAAGRFLDCRFAGASEPMHGPILEALFPSPAAAGQAYGCLHLCATDADRCQETTPNRQACSAFVEPAPSSIRGGATCTLWGRPRT